MLFRSACLGKSYSASLSIRVEMGAALEPAEHVVTVAEARYRGQVCEERGCRVRTGS